MNVSIRKAELFDINGFLKLDKHIAPERLKTVISAGRAFVLENSGQIFGVLRYSLFWEVFPF